MIDILYDSNSKVPDVVNIIDNVNLYLSDTLVQPQSEKIDITESEVDIEVKNEIKSEVKRNNVLGTQDNTKDVLVIPLHTNKVKSSSPCKQNPSKYSLF